MADLHISVREGLGIAQVQARKGVTTAAISTALGVKMPEASASATRGNQTVIGIGPGKWMVVAQDPSRTWPAPIIVALKNLASVTDQSAAYWVVRLRGDLSHALLQRGTSIDLHPTAFPADAAAATVIAHINTLFWRHDETDFDLAAYRSYAGDLSRWLTQAAASMVS